MLYNPNVQSFVDKKKQVRHTLVYEKMSSEYMLNRWMDERFLKWVRLEECIKVKCQIDGVNCWEICSDEGAADHCFSNWAGDTDRVSI